jgi:streptomycin 6-kinase
MNLPPDFTRRVTLVFEPDGAPWLERLPDTIETVARRWGLEVAPHFPGLSYNYVAPARLADGAPVVLKLGVPCEELGTEIDALRHYAGRGACRLLDADEALGALLLERLQPGHMLSALAAADDEAATRVAAQVMASLWAPPPAAHRFTELAQWTAGLAELRPHFGGGTGPFPADLVDRAEGHFADMLASQPQPVVLHGDLHHYNILAAGPDDREAGAQPYWRAIDPKGLVGDPAYECAAFICNPAPQIAADPQLPRTLERRIAIFAETLGIDRRRIYGYALGQAVLGSWWSYADEGVSDDPFMAVARALATLRP